MKLLKCSVQNFGSYLDLSFSFDTSGLALIYGPTGSGKSMIPDMPCWILFGITAKDGNADDVVSWQAEGDTVGVLDLDVKGTHITVTRKRGKSNDLYWTEGGEDQKHRGKDLAESQKFLNKRLGVDAALYLTSAYFCDFSPTASFFVAKPKDRREVFESIVDLAFPVKIAEVTSEARKKSKKEFTEAQTAYDRASGQLEQLEAQSQGVTAMSARWEETHIERLQALKDESDNFEVNRAARVSELTKKVDKWELEHEKAINVILKDIEALGEETYDPIHYESQVSDLKGKMLKIDQERCPTCGGPKKSDDKFKLQQKIHALQTKITANRRNQQTKETLLDSLQRCSNELNPFIAQLEQAGLTGNTYHEEIRRAEKEENPYRAQIKKVEGDTLVAQTKVDNLKAVLAALTKKHSALNTLYDLSFELRGALLKKKVAEIQEQTNEYLEKYFDAELRVGFTLEGSDSLTVSITKSGYTCAYRQLSKGQRQLLKLCFGRAIMEAAANRAGVQFDNLFFDEALDGLDADLKVKAFPLFQDLEKTHNSVLLIDHAPEFQQLFDRRYRVSMEADVSTVEEES